MIVPKVIVQIPGFQGPPGENGKPGKDGRGVPDFSGQTDAVLKTNGRKTYWGQDKSSTYVYEQGTLSPSNVWIINHNLGKYPSVTVVDSAGTRFECETHYLNENTCVVNMSVAMSGKAYLN